VWTNCCLWSLASTIDQSNRKESLKRHSLSEVPISLSKPPLLECLAPLSVSQGPFHAFGDHVQEVEVEVVSRHHRPPGPLVSQS